MKQKPYNEYRIHVAKKLVPADVWNWLLVQIETPYSNCECIELLPDSDLAIEYHERMRNY